MLEKITGHAAGIEQNDDDQVSRRDVLKTAAAAGLLAALPVLSTAAYADDTPPPPPPPAKPKEDWKTAGDADSFKENEPQKVDLGVAIAWVTRLDARNFDGVSAHCTHRGCELGYDPQSTNLVCPCHGSVFKLDGDNVVGTRMSPDNHLPHLKTLPVRVKDGQVQVNVAPVE